MEIVPTSTPKRKVSGLEELILRKEVLKEQIQTQKEIISTSSRQLLSPASITNSIFHSFTKGLNMVDGVLIGYKIIRSIRRIFRRK